MSQPTCSALVRLLLLVALLLLGASPAARVAGNLRGSPHDFRSPANGGPNRRYVYLAEMAGASPCAACHTPHGAAGGSLLSADFGLRLDHPMQETSAKCLACHDGVATTPYGEETLPPAKRLRRHWHKVEFTYPPRWPPGFGFRSLVHDRDNQMSVPGRGSQSLPLVYDAQAEAAKATCVTCHDPHSPGRSGRFLRADSRAALCQKCHQGELGFELGMAWGMGFGAE